jgi:hypothetical protein
LTLDAQRRFYPHAWTSRPASLDQRTPEIAQKDESASGREMELAKQRSTEEERERERARERERE